jgi:tetratricopeptide (TPR) repeat protein
MDVTFQPERNFLHARTTVTLYAAQAVRAIEFELNPELKILEVADREGRLLEFERSRRLGSPSLSVRLATPASEEITLRFTYEGVLPPKLLDYITKDGILLRDESRWYPAVDLSAFTMNDITVRLTGNWTVVTAGEPGGALVTGISHNMAINSRTLKPVSSRAIVAMPQAEPCRPWNRRIRVQPSPPLRFDVTTCVRPEYAERSLDLATQVSQLLEWHTNLSGCGIRGLAIVQGFPGQRGAIGYSAPGFLVVSEDFVKFFAYPGYAPEFLPHEIAHQWFPIQVALARQEDGWLAESLAEYLAWRYLEEKDPEQARGLVARAVRDALAPDPLRPLSLGLRLFALENWEVTRATLYQRGMLVWRTLETVIGRERVDRTLAEYYKRYAGHAASIADFRRICEEIAGRNLTWFFEYFINGTRTPEMEFRRTQAAAPGEVAGEIVFNDVPPEFQVRLEMRLETSAGAIKHSVATRGPVTPFAVTAPQPITRLTLDPDSKILRWTEAARRNRSQRALLARLRELERASQYRRAVEICRKALALDPEGLASNEQRIRFELGRLYQRMSLPAEAMQEFSRALARNSLDPMEGDFIRAWSLVFRARIERRQNRLAAARRDAQAGLVTISPALLTPVSWPEAPEKTTTARAELEALAR